MKSVGDEYVAASVFYVPPKARYGYTIANAQRSRLGRFFDDVMDVIERIIPSTIGGNINEQPGGTLFFRVVKAEGKWRGHPG